MLAFSSSNRLCIHSASRFAGHRDSLWIFGPSGHQHFVVFQAISQKLLVRFTSNLIHNTLRGSDMPFSITVLWLTFGAEIWLLSHFFILHLVSGADLWNCWLDCSHMSYEESQEGFSPALNLTRNFIEVGPKPIFDFHLFNLHSRRELVDQSVLLFGFKKRSPFVLCA